MLVPLAYCGSVLALILAAGATSGIGLVILVPLIWTALYQRRWESACVVVAIAAVELIISLTPVAAPGVVLSRRVILWTALGTVIAFAAHELRDRSHRSRQEAARLQAGLTELTLLRTGTGSPLTCRTRSSSRFSRPGWTCKARPCALTSPKCGNASWLRLMTWIR